MPLYTLNHNIILSKILIFVPTIIERDEILDHLKNLHHSERTNFDRLYNRNMIENSYVLALEELSKLSPEKLVKLDDLPLHTILKIKKVKVRKEIYETVQAELQIAFEKSYLAVKEYAEKYGDTGPCGYAHLVTWNPNSEITQALIDLKLAYSFGDGYYTIKDLKPYPIQSIDANEKGAIAAVEYLNEKLGKMFSYRTRWD